jgi:hypothetical protein
MWTNATVWQTATRVYHWVAPGTAAGRAISRTDRTENDPRVRYRRPADVDLARAAAACYLLWKAPLPEPLSHRGGSFCVERTADGLVEPWKIR